jgi:sugar O-acyltransferase (sialic acid O-acetyltransferase NeuD family)
MLIVGAKGFAKEVLEILYQLNQLDDICFFDDVNSDISDVLYNRFKVLKSNNEVKQYFKNRNRFTIGIGHPKRRETMFFKFNNLGGEVVSVISPKASIGNFGNKFASGCNIMTGVIITNDVSLGKCCLINLNSTIGHNSKLGDFVELSPNVNVSGNCIIGDYTSIGTNAIILPNINIGINCIIGAGSVVTKNIPDNSIVIGVPGQIIKQNI